MNGFKKTIERLGLVEKGVIDELKLGGEELLDYLVQKKILDSEYLPIIKEVAEDVGSENQLQVLRGEQKILKVQCSHVIKKSAKIIARMRDAPIPKKHDLVAVK